MRARWLAVLVAGLVAAAACTAGSTTSVPTGEGYSQPAGTPVKGGTVTFGHVGEPTTLNPMIRQGQVRATSMVAHTVLAGAYRVTPDFEYVPHLLDGEAETSGGNGEQPFTVTWTLKQDLQWSDGEPLTAQDLQFTYETIMDPDNAIDSRAGYELITDTRVVDEHTWQAEFSEKYAPYRRLFSGTDVVLPAHVLKGEDFDDAWQNGIVDPDTGEGIASGPFVFEEWQRGDSLTVVRNERYWGEKASLDSITWTWAENSAALVEQLQRGAVDIAQPPPRPSLVARARQLEGVRVQTAAGAGWEQLTFNFEHDVLSWAFVRKAIILAIDRQALVDKLVERVHPQTQVLQNAVYVTNRPEYEPHWDRWDHNPQRAVRLLKEHGCTRGDSEGQEDQQGVFSCDSQKLSFRYIAVSGIQRRARLFELIEKQLSEVGIELRRDFGPAREVLGRKLADGAFDMANFGWVGGVDPSGGDSVFVCGGHLNYADYCNRQVSELIRGNTTILDESERAAVYNRADARLAEDVALVPLFQVPVVLAFDEQLGGVRVNPTQIGPTWNAGEWYRVG